MSAHGHNSDDAADERGFRAGVTLGSALIPASLAEIGRMARAAGERVVGLLRDGITSRLILTREVFANAITVHVAIGGSLNAGMHLIESAREAGIEIAAADSAQIHRRTPVLVDAKTAGRYPTELFWYSGGVPALTAQLRVRLHLDARPVSGSTDGEDFDRLVGGLLGSVNSHYHGLNTNEIHFLFSETVSTPGEAVAVDVTMKRLGPLRVAVAALMYETNSFAPGVSTSEKLRRSGWADGDEVFTYGRGIDSIAGAMKVAAQEGVTLIPTTAAGPASGSIIAAGEYAQLRERLLDGMRPLVGKVNGVYLSLHGAMVCEDEDDVEGDILQSVSELMGVPVSASFDLHCHFTDKMGQVTPLISGYHTCPHVDIFEVGERSMSLLIHRLRGGNPTLSWVQIPMLTSSEGQDTNVEPVRSIISRLKDMIDEPKVLDGALFMTQPWLDVPGVGWTALVVTDDDPELAKRYAVELGEMAWRARDRVLAPKVEISDAINRVCAAQYDSKLGPFVLSDGADSVSAGAAGDGVALVTALSAAPLPGPALAVIADAPAASLCHRAGVGSRVELRLGGTVSQRFFTEALFEGTVISVHEKGYPSIYPPNSIDPGQVAVVKTDNGLHLIITEHPVPQLDLEVFRHVGLDPTKAHVLVAKSAGGYRAYFEPIARECIDVATSGPADSRLEQLPFGRITRPLYPFDRDIKWSPVPQVSERR
jgi:microcystin degradation protein MlrC